MYRTLLVFVFLVGYNVGIVGCAKTKKGSKPAAATTAALPPAATITASPTHTPGRPEYRCPDSSHAPLRWTDAPGIKCPEPNCGKEMLLVSVPPTQP